MGEDSKLRQRYLRRMTAGAILLAVLAIPAIVHSNAAIHSLLNRPIDWVPDTLSEKAAFNELCRRFVVSDALLISWPGATLESEGLREVTRAFDALSSHLGSDPAQPPTSAAPASDSPQTDAVLPGAAWVDAIADVCESRTPFLEVQSGASVVDKMTASPSSLSRRSAIARLKGFLVGPDGDQTCLVITLDEPAHAHRRAVLPLMRELIAEVAEVENSQIAIVGGPRDGADVDTESIRSINVFAPPSAVIAALICFICLRSLPLTIAITAIAVIGEGMVLALVYYTGTPMNAVLIVLPPLVFVLTISAGIHLSNYFLDASHEFPELTASQAAKRAIRAGIVPCFLATGTTVVGLGSLMLVRIEPIRVFGFVASVGVLSTLLLLLLVLPGAMILGREWKEKKLRQKGPAPHQPEALTPAAERRRSKIYSIVRMRLSRPWPTLIIFFLFAGGLASGLGSLKTSVNLLRMFQPDSAIRQEYAWFEEHVGATSTAELLVEFPPLGEQDSPLDRFAVVRAAHVAAMQSDPVGGAVSAVSFTRTIPSGKSWRDSSTRAAIAEMIRDDESGLGDLGLISRDAESEVWRITLRLWDPDSVDYSVTLAAIEATAREVVQQEAGKHDLSADVVLTGPAVVVHEAQKVLLGDLFRSFLTAFAVVAVVMVFVLKSLRGGLVAMIPNLFPTVALFGWMGLRGTPLDIGSVMSASVALGIAVDDTVHLLSRFGSRRAQGLGQIRAAHGALSQCGWAMLQTTMVCGLSLMVYWFSDFVPTSQFALLMFGLLLAALLGDVFLLPSLMASRLGRSLAHTVGSDPKARLENDDRLTPVDARRVPVKSS
ncbi:MMPL family transporter [Stieleria sp. TO1_6]|uniref:efflux RND transporter permease subunit n=1 Tax=Stieleria tagensis TaxID=2956795 RepID=UPI00209BAA5D|nr:MMPL family transporter [Stieleria tagensis]MCO8124410.1 MMPL family transporter [Stieleria tagensis]